MFKPVHAAIGTLEEVITATDTTIKVSNNLFCVLRDALSDGSYTYLIIKDLPHYEVVKANGVVGYGVQIDRGHDGTIAQAFPQGSNVEFILSKSAIVDIINDEALGEINLRGEGIIDVTKTATNSYTISAPKFNIVSNSDKILVGGEFPNFILSTPLMTDCCD